MKVIVKDKHANQVGVYKMSVIPRKGELLVLVDKEIQVGPGAYRLGPPSYDVFAVVWHLDEEPFVVVHGMLRESGEYPIWPEDH